VGQAEREGVDVDRYRENDFLNLAIKYKGNQEVLNLIEALKECQDDDEKGENIKASFGNLDDLIEGFEDDVKDLKDGLEKLRAHIEE
jgi:hypothetical protein